MLDPAWLKTISEVLRDTGLVGLLVVEAIVILRLFNELKSSNAERAKDAADHVERLVKITQATSECMKETTITCLALKEQIRDLRGK